MSSSRAKGLREDSTTRSVLKHQPFPVNPLTPNDPYRGRTAPLTSKRCILYIYSTNIGTEYFKHGIYSSFFSLQNAVLFHNSNVFGSCIINILYTGCAKVKKKNNSGAKRLMCEFKIRSHDKSRSTNVTTRNKIYEGFS